MSHLNHQMLPLLPLCMRCLRCFCDVKNPSNMKAIWKASCVHLFKSRSYLPLQSWMMASQRFHYAQFKQICVLQIRSPVLSATCFDDVAGPAACYYVNVSSTAWRVMPAAQALGHHRAHIRNSSVEELEIVFPGAIVLRIWPLPPLLSLKSVHV